MSDWLHSLGLAQYADALRDADIGPETLPDLTDDDLKSLGMSLGHRKKLLRAIADLRTTPQAPLAPDNKAATLERRQISALFCDLIGSTALSTRLDPEDLHNVLQSYVRCCTDLVAKFGGSITNLQGDGLLARFGYPHAHEDDAERAIRCGIAIGEAVRRLTNLPEPGLRVRIGIATGSLVVGDAFTGTMEPATVGDAPNLAARLQTLAGAGEVVVDELTRQLAAGAFSYLNLGQHQLKGFDAPTTAWRVTGVRHDASRFAARHADRLMEMVGRQHELGLLIHRWEEAASGEGRVVVLMGEAGIGKSRLVAGLLGQLPAGTHTPLWQCSPYHTNTALYPALEQLTRAAGLVASDPPPEKLNKLERVVGRQDFVADFAELLAIPTGDSYPKQDLTPAERKKKLLHAMLYQLRRAAEHGPFCFIIEDMHWIDPTSLELLELGVDLVQELPVLMVVTARPEIEPPWRTRGHVTTLTVGRLNRTECTRMVELVLGRSQLPNEVLQPLVERAAGIPLFVEELARSALDSGLLEPSVNQHFLRPADPHGAIPSSLQGSLIERLDRLSGVKEIAQVASVIGSNLTVDLLAKVAGFAPSAVQPILETLVSADIMQRRTSGPETSYSFRHSLIQDATYNSLLRGRRRELHSRVADTFESKFPDRCRDEPELLAHHLSQAGNPQLACTYWLRAAQQAVERSANREVVAHTGRALEMLATLKPSPERDSLERALHACRLAPACSVYGFSSDEVEGICKRLRELSEEAGDPRQIYLALYGEFLLRLTRADIPQAVSLGDQMTELTRGLGDQQPYRHSLRNRALASFFAGNFTEMAKDIDYLDSLKYEFTDARPSDYSPITGFAILNIYKALLLWCTGSVEPSQAALKASVEAAEASRRTNIQLLVFHLGAMLLSFQHDMKGLAQIVEQLERLSGENRFPNYLNSARAFQGVWNIANGDFRAGTERLTAALAELDRIKTRFMRPLFLSWLALGLAGQQRPIDAVNSINDAELHVTERGEAVFAPLVQYVKATLLQQQGDTVTAEAAFREAVDLALANGAVMFAIKPAAALVRLLRAQNRSSEAAAILALVRPRLPESIEVDELAFSDPRVA